MRKIKYYIFCIKWLYKNRNWDNTRQKFKRMEKDFKESEMNKYGRKIRSNKK